MFYVDGYKKLSLVDFVKIEVKEKFFLVIFDDKNFIMIVDI